MNAAPLLNAYKIPFTLFVVTNWAEGKHVWNDIMLDWRGIEQLATAGATVASHSMSHPNFGKLGGDDARYELAESRRLIEHRIGIKTAEFAIPLGQSANWTPAAAIAASELGYEIIYAQSVDRRPPGTVPRTFITGCDGCFIFRAAISGAFDAWEEHS
jgi:peptidoglycan/xylan/chitin deacetylase (PgdA/CDA1 family)